MVTRAEVKQTRSKCGLVTLVTSGGNLQIIAQLSVVGTQCSCFLTARLCPTSVSAVHLARGCDAGGEGGGGQDWRGLTTLHR